MNQQLPDIFETRQAQALLKALQDGDVEQARRIEDHLVAEAATSPEDGERLRDELRAAMLFRAQVDASAAGDEQMAELFKGLLQTMCSEHVVKLTVAGALLNVGLRQGLPAKEHDQLMEWFEEFDMSDDMRALAAGIQRLP